MDELNIRVNEKFDLMSIIEQGGIVCLKLMIGDILFVSGAVVQVLNTWINQFTHKGSSKTVGDNIAQLMIQFMSCSIRLSEVKNMPIESATYLLEDITK